MKDLATKEQFVELRARGQSLSAISSSLSVAKSTLVEWGKEMAVEITILKQGEMEALLEKYRLHKECRLKIYSNQLEKVSKELEGRDYSKVPTEKLIDLSIKLMDSARKEEPIDPFGVALKPTEQDIIKEKEIEEMRQTLADMIDDLAGTGDTQEEIENQNQPEIDQFIAQHTED